MNQPRVEPGGGDELAVVLAELAGHITDARTETVQDLQLRLGGARLRVLLVGEAKRGKSTVGNAILRREVLPTGVIPLTAVATTVTLGSPERVEVHGLDGNIVTAPLSELAGYVTEAGNPGNERGVGEVVVRLTGGLPHPSVQLVDTPGVGSVHQHNTEAAQAAMTRMDLAVFVLSADPPISAAEQVLLSRVRGLSARTIIILNKVDQLDPADRVEAEQFTRRAASAALGVPANAVALFSVSAREAVRAVTARDDAGWVDSGMAAFIQALQQQLDRSWRTDLAASIAGSARRVASELIDESALTRRAHELSATSQASQVAAFARCLDNLAIHREDASAVATAHLNRWRALLDADAENAIMSATATVHQHLDATLSGTGEAPIAELETAGWTILNDLIVTLVGQWRTTWTQSLTEAAAEATRRQQQLLDEAFTDLRAAAATLLGVGHAGAAVAAARPEDVPIRHHGKCRVGRAGHLRCAPPDSRRRRSPADDAVPDWRGDTAGGQAHRPGQVRVSGQHAAARPRPANRRRHWVHGAAAAAPAGVGCRPPPARPRRLGILGGRPEKSGRTLANTRPAFGSDARQPLLTPPLMARRRVAHIVVE